ncbi:hypothetical protein AK830_g11819 [Neonectria ditissima]|uniref:Mating-type switching protein swi10 n=1 Tax=Neonectria ditissima TaxID=78410 RepID=A0A0P7B247_9HYPO|nr:hypothetical protein AK830_g11819 [Neonectria ditissima]
MEQSPALANSRSQDLKPTRRRLQKSPKLKGHSAKRASTDSTASRNTEAPALSPRRIQSGAPDLSDSKWSHYLRPKTVVSPVVSDLEPEPAYQVVEQPTQCSIPEFSHLAIRDSPARPSLDSSDIPSPASSTSTTSTMRRQAKTPVFRIGQLEKSAARRNQGALAKTSSVELIADQYQGVLESRGGPEMKPIYDDSHLGNEPWRVNALDVPRSLQLRDQHNRPQPASRTHLEPLQQSKPSPQSATTPDGTVAFGEDAIYFKPISFSTDPSPDPSPRFSHQSFESSASSRPVSLDNLSLQICLNLLTRELFAAVEDGPHRNSADSAALQVWVMIEAYEKLRDQVASMTVGNGELENVCTIFDTWLSALYAIHETMTLGALPSEGDYAGMEETLD